MDVHNDIHSHSELIGVQERSSYEKLRDARVVELTEKLKPVEAASNKL
jgi:hypothetical protein